MDATWLSPRMLLLLWSAIGLLLFAAVIILERRVLPRLYTAEALAVLSLCLLFGPFTLYFLAKDLRVHMRQAKSRLTVCKNKE